MRLERARRVAWTTLRETAAIRRGITEERERLRKLRASAAIRVSTPVPASEQRRRPRDARRPAPRLRALRPREIQVLLLYQLGLATPEIAEVFVISVNTVRTHANLALKRLDAHSRAEALAVLEDPCEWQYVDLAYQRLLPALARWRGRHHPPESSQPR